MSVITNVAVVKVDTNANLQKKELIPGKWLTSEGNADLISEICAENNEECSESKDYFSDLKDTHYKELYRTIDLIIDQVSEEQIQDSDSGKMYDFIDKAVESLELEKKYQKCPSCGILLEKSKRKCPECHISISEYKTKAGNTEEKIGTQSKTNQIRPLMSQYQPKSKQTCYVSIWSH